MPIYEYHCKKCGIDFEALLKSTESEPTTCEECGSRRIGRVMSQTSFVLKGSGWYKTDYAASGDKSSTGKSTSKSSSTGSESSSGSESSTGSESSSSSSSSSDA